jgi:hypothetical protein
MPPKAEHTVHILEGKATLYKREGTPFWHLRYKVYGKWHRQTTKQTVLKKAKSTAVEIYADSTFRERNSLPPNNKRFKAVANLAIRSMDELTEAIYFKLHDLCMEVIYKMSTSP